MTDLATLLERAQVLGNTTVEQLREAIATLPDDDDSCWYPAPPSPRQRVAAAVTLADQGIKGARAGARLRELLIHLVAVEDYERKLEDRPPWW